MGCLALGASASGVCSASVRSVRLGIVGGVPRLAERDCSQRDPESNDGSSRARRVSAEGACRTGNLVAIATRARALASVPSAGHSELASVAVGDKSEAWPSAD
jgi:hypothetical protein